MNLSVIILALLALQATKRSQAQPKANIADLFSDETRALLECVGTLTDKQASSDDKTGALLQMLSNPKIAELAEGLLHPRKEFANEEGYKFDTPSQASKDFFKPIDNVADAEVKHKLYGFYDNWYVK